MTTPLRVDLVDISNWQAGAIGWKAIGEAGVLGVYHKATEGTTYRDPKYPARRRGVHKSNRVRGRKRLGYGAYHFARPSASDGTTQARYFLAYARPRPGDLRPMLDLEDRGGKNKAALTKWVREFVAEVKHQTGVEPVIYTKFDLGHHFDCPLWTASYADDNRPPYVAKPWSTWTIWQFSDGQYGVPTHVDGLPGGDLNTINHKDPAHIVAVLTIGHKPPRKRPAKKPAPKPAPAPVEKVDPAPEHKPEPLPQQAEHDLEHVYGSPARKRLGHRLADRIRAAFRRFRRNHR